MNNEIKLMLNIIKDVSEHKEGSRNGLMILSCKDYKTLLDYITNLQQGNERLKEELKFIYDINHHNLGERIRLEGIILKANELLDHLGYGGSDEYYMKKINEIKDVINEGDNNE